MKQRGKGLPKRSLLLAIASAFLAPCSTAWGAAPGATGFDFLKLYEGPRSAAMGGAGVGSLEDDLDGAMLNPASLAYLSRQQLSSSYVNVFSQAQFGELGYGRPTRGYGVFAGQFLYLGYDPIQGYDASNNPTGNLNADDMLAIASWATSIGRNLSLGVNGKWARETLADASANAFALDVGAAYDVTAVRGLSAGLAVRNLGISTRFDSKAERLPLLESAGLYYSALARSLNLALDFQQAADSRAAIQPRFGVEYWMLGLLAGRVGYVFNQDIGSGFTFGLGLRLSSQLEGNYSFEPYSSLGNLQRFSIAYHFGAGTAETLYEQGLTEMRRGRYAEAVLLFDKALTLRPDYTAAIKALKEAGNLLKSDLKNP